MVGLLVGCGWVMSGEEERKRRRRETGGAREGRNRRAKEWERGEKKANRCSSNRIVEGGATGKLDMRIVQS
ncbi:MAG: hypothetical protein CL912_23150 [Deltaproteobacteria bacterium]|nr:hypothetical protein [Deltaproteobacteria bacterium]